MEPNKQDAEMMLAHAGQAQRAVSARTPKEHVPFIAWGAFMAILVPGFDLVDRTTWGWTTIAVAVALFAATGAYFVARERQVRVADRTPSWTWVALTAGVCLGGAVAEVLDDSLAFSYVLGGVIAAVPLLLWGERLRRGA